jgi:hypothetical protein
MYRASQPRYGALLCGLISIAGGCARDPEVAYCPTVAGSDLVISEVRGEQSDLDEGGQWIELFNASGQSVDLMGLHVSLLRLDGSDALTVLVRRPLELAAGDYVVIGAFADDSLPDHVDYGAGTDLDQDLFDGAALDVDTCVTTRDETEPQRVDRILYDALPRTGTYSLGLSPPDASGNDNDGMWCTNSTLDGNGLPWGTPGEANPPCAP